MAIYDIETDSCVQRDDSRPMAKRTLDGRGTADFYPGHGELVALLEETERREHPGD